MEVVTNMPADASPHSAYGKRTVQRSMIGEVEIQFKQLFGQPCVNVRVSDKALPRLAAGNSAKKKKRKHTPLPAKKGAETIRKRRENIGLFTF